MAINYNGKTYDQDWFEIDAMGRRIGDKKDWAANADYASRTGTQNPYTNQAGSSPHDATGWIPGNEPGSTMPKGPAPGGWLDHARIAAYQKSLTQPKAAATLTPAAPSPYVAAAAPSRGAQRQSVSGGSADPSSAIAEAYRQYLGRDASPAEVQGWTSGSYGGGGLAEWLNQIQNSPEARQRQVIGQPRDDRNHTMTDPVYGTPAPMPQGYVSPEIAEVERRYNGGSPPNQPLLVGHTWQWDGWDWKQVPGAGGAPTAPTTTTPTTAPSVPGPQGGNFQSWFQQLTNGKRVSPKTLKELEPILNQYGIKLGPLNARGFTDGIILPDGTFVDVILSATEDGGTGWGWIIPGPGGHGGGYGGPQQPPTQYSDPHTQFLEQMLQQMIQSRMTPVNDPNRALYDQMLKQRADALGRLTPQLDQQIKYLEDRFKDLQTSGYTGAEGEAIRTGALDPIEQDRQAARKRVLERLSARGLNLDSGIAQQALLEVDKAFDGMRAATQTTLTTNDLARREDRQGRAETIRNTLSQIPEGRAREQLDVFSALDQLSALTRAENEARQREALGYSGALSDLGPQRLQLAMQAAGLGGNPSSMFGNLMQLASMNQNAALYAAQNRNSWMEGLGEWMYSLSRSGR